MDTTALQRALIAHGHPLPRFGADGDFGGETRTAMQAFQRKAGLRVTERPDAATISALQAAAKTEPQSLAPLDRAKFFAYLRSAKAPMFGASLSRSQVAGIEGILDAFAVAGDGRDKTLGYGLATARREVGAGMVPVREGFKKTDAEARAYCAAPLSDEVRQARRAVEARLLWPRHRATHLAEQHRTAVLPYRLAGRRRCAGLKRHPDGGNGDHSGRRAPLAGRCRLVVGLSGTASATPDRSLMPMSDYQPPPPDLLQSLIGMRLYDVIFGAAGGVVRGLVVKNLSWPQRIASTVVGALTAGSECPRQSLARLVGLPALDRRTRWRGHLHRRSRRHDCLRCGYPLGAALA